MIDSIENTDLSRYATDNQVSRNATIDIPVSMLGISKPHLVRPLDDLHVAELVDTDETEWEPIEVRVWPADWPKPSPDVAYHVVSGNHRTSAALIKNLQSVRVQVIEASDDLVISRLPLELMLVMVAISRKMSAR